MIDGWSLAVSALWILGLALGLAAASFAYWLPSSRKATGLESHATRNVRALIAAAGLVPRPTATGHIWAGATQPER